MFFILPKIYRAKKNSVTNCSVCDIDNVFAFPDRGGILRSQKKHQLMLKHLNIIMKQSH